ncbi:uroporphyrinogen-III C-methyltransferase [Pyxidicoccus xibeiensis]|uniref:uroporphyrinogen-III C-methyltransferase n=1 Tax=Pyxidicoccus xibeiensis TaxID=2906759 RepID=UPI0020A7E133|nr:uroporphyrinogen-III C-methyltransferase [Pyxidicoccus xibeiensis]MCP3145025.1 uroporphyrinogen-III C-methyltransferase [Pyxidicoccus xibeiensis]
MSEYEEGRVYLVGAGPGDPELLTLRAARLLREADTVVHDRLIHPAVLEHARPRARLIYVGKAGRGESVQQAEIHKVLITQARLGRKVVRLKGGDPFVFGRGGEEALALEAAGIPYEVVPGLSAGFAVPASAAIPVTHRDVSGAVTFATAHRSGGTPDWDFLAKAQTLVLFMAGDRLDETVRALVSAGRARSTPAAIVEAGTWEEQRVVEATLGDIPLKARRAAIGSPSLLIVGEVVSMRSKLPTLVARGSSMAGHGLARMAEGGNE